MTVDAVIVGAGISGLFTAKQLVERGRSVKVLERRDRVGGRLLSVPVSDDQGARLDLGATWFWPGEPRVLALVQELGLQVHSQHIDGDALYHEPGSTPEDPATSRRIDGNPLDVPSGRFTDGADSLTQALADALPPGSVQLNQTVRAVIKTDPGLFEVETTDQPGDRDQPEVFSARHIVLALPPALAIHDISFQPPLTERLRGLAATTPVWMGSTMKAVVHYRQPFWRDHGLAGSAISHIGPMRELHDMSGPDGTPAAIFGFIPQTGQSGPPTEAEVVNQLVELFGPEAGEPVTVIIADWPSDPATSPPGAARLQAYQTYGHSLYQEPTMDGRLHWASTETAAINPGHIEGAIAAAERTVAAIEAHLSSQATSI